VSQKSVADPGETKFYLVVSDFATTCVFDENPR